MRCALILCLAALCLAAADTLEVFGHKWSVYKADDWNVIEDAGAKVLHLGVGREPLPGPRRPFQFALAETPAFRKVTIEADAKPLKRSLIVVFAYQDEAHFNYAHFSTDPAAKVAVHNGIFHVYGGERVRISPPEGAASFAAAQTWYHIKLVWDGERGEVQGYVNGEAVQSLHAFDLSLHRGRVGVGSFDETADFKSLQIRGEQ